MYSRLLTLWEALRTSYWFVPVLMIVAAAVLALSIVRFEDAPWVQEAVERGWLYTGGIEGAREILSTTAGSAISIAGVVFSITIVVLSLASSNLGPRLIRSFMHDYGSQMVLGAFVATFIYCILTLRAVDGEQSDPFVPHLAVTIAIVLAVVDVVVLIYFIHHMAEAIQAPNVIHTVSRELSHAIETLYPQALGHPPPTPTQRPIDAIPDDFETNHYSVTGHSEGYLQVIDVDALMALACERDALVRLHIRPGDFVHANSTICAFYPADHYDDQADKALRQAINVGAVRTPVQDALFLVDQIAEIAIRALSPSINDPFTAMAALERLTAQLIVLAGRSEVPAYRFDDQQRLRVIAASAGFEDMLRASYRPILLHARQNTLVCEHAAGLFADLATCVSQPDQLEALARLIADITELFDTAITSDADRRLVHDAMAKARQAVETRQTRS